MKKIIQNPFSWNTKIEYLVENKKLSRAEMMKKIHSDDNDKNDSTNLSPDENIRSSVQKLAELISTPEIDEYKNMFMDMKNRFREAIKNKLIEWGDDVTEANINFYLNEILNNPYGDKDYIEIEKEVNKNADNYDDNPDDWSEKTLDSLEQQPFNPKITNDTFSKIYKALNSKNFKSYLNSQKNI